MKTKYLLPHRWKILGWILIAVCIPLGVWCLIPNSEFPFTLEIILPWTTDGSQGLLDPQIVDGHMVLDILDELISVGCIVGLLILGFSRQMVEDERIAQMRLEALQWGVYANYLALVIFILTVYGSGFFMVTVYNMFTLLLIFVGRFYWLLYAKPLIEGKRERDLSL